MNVRLSHTDDGMASRVPGDTIAARLVSVRYGARNANIYELARIDGRVLPAAEPGAHIDVHLRSGIVRQYSLIEAHKSPKSYLIAVKREENSRGGSSFLHDESRVGQTIEIGAPRNNFPLADAEHTVLIAGGIGITPIWSMWRSLRERGRSVQLIYSCRSRSDALFQTEMASDGAITLHFADEATRKVLDFREMLSWIPQNAHLYCCGPQPMLAAFSDAVASWPKEQIHLEHFTPVEAAATEGGYTVQLVRSGKNIEVQAGQTILAAMRDAGISAPFSCQEGICGACMTKVLAGVPDHRDSVLSEAERRAGDKIIICCSGSKTDKLELDL